MKMFISSLMLILSFNMISLSHPLSLGLLILIQTLLLCLMMGLIIKTYWFSYILFLTFLGGLLVLFIYVSSVASNELFKMSFYFKLNWILSMLFIILFMLLIKIYNMNFNWLNFSNNMMDNNNFINIYMMNINSNKINLNKLYNNQTYILMMMLIIYLFISLVAVVKITNIFYGPLRKS